MNYRLEEEVNKLIYDYQKTKSEQNLIILINNYMPLCYSIVRPYSYGTEIYEDLVQIGTIGLILAIQKFDSSKGSEFISYAAPTISGEIKKYLRDKTWAIHVPRRIKEMIPKIKKSYEFLILKYQREPSIQEISDHLNINKYQVIQAINLIENYKAKSLDVFVLNYKMLMVDLISSEESGYKRVDEFLWIESFFSVLTKREAKLLKLLFINDLNQKEAAKTLGISQVHVSRLQKKALSKLRDSLYRFF